ncbi:hypothetical protein GH975_07560 [Litorivicinus lipolyticus]|uniref:Uncharacterized protein n=1 Tax=Litorivicinus lipolyticus TaxID=418701 RepID=A0A5Q2QEI3_9GAMM|nr:hypothetical protein [Litorivicinus lipolyticus]QGG80436.1 hypothetical protein GH975_07560 [Litorivicinus lipolyticus]
MQTAPQVTTSLRPAAEVMRLARLGSMHASRLSFMRILLRRLKHQAWRFERTRFAFDAAGEGCAVYTARGPERAYSLVAFGRDLPDDLRSDRVIATAWDATFTLFDGIPTDADIDRLAANVPLQEAGRVSASELSLSRANRSVRLWAHVVERLSNGVQPDQAELDAVGYLMRTTAVYGSGKFGAADRETLADRAEFQAPFQVEMLSVLLTRQFARDWVEHQAQVIGGANAVGLDEALARRLGIGNSTGLGMAPFLLNHPVLLNNWILAKETALAEVCTITDVTGDAWQQVRSLLARVQGDIASWHSEHAVMQIRLPALRADVARLVQAMQSPPQGAAWRDLIEWARQTLGVEAQELLHSLVLEPYPSVDRLAVGMAADEVALPAVDGSATVADTAADIAARYRWALETDWSTAPAHARLWYVSEEKLEPRLAERLDEPLEPYEQPLAPGRDMALAYHALCGFEGERIAEFLLRHPQHRLAIQRLQWLKTAPYGEIHDNTIGADLLPIDMLRCKLSFFGAARFDPRSDRWVRICMFRHAPYLDGVAECADDWMYAPQ